MWERILVIGAVVVACACGGDGSSSSGERVPAAQTNAGMDAAVPARPAEGRRRILFIGTSLTAGQGLDPDSAFPALIGAKIDSAGLPYEVTNAGVSGETTAGALRRIDWLMRDSAAVIVLETGANDGLRALNVDSTRANIAAILRQIRVAQPRAKVYLVQMEAVPNLGVDYTSGFHDMYPSLAREAGVELIPFLLNGVAGDPRLNQGDGIHPNEEGEKMVAENVWRVMRGYLVR